MNANGKVHYHHGPAICRSGTDVSVVRRWPALLLPCLLFGLSILPIAATKIPPLVDYPNHLARMYIISHHHLFTRYFNVNWHLVPDLGMDTIVPLLTRFVDVFNAGKVVICLTIFLIASGTFALHYALYREWKGPILSFLFVFNGIFLYGFVNYLLSIGVALWVTAGWIALRNSYRLLRTIFSTVAILLLFFCHLGGVGLYALAVLCYELSLIGCERKLRRRLLDAAGMVVPFFIVIPLMLASSTSHDWANTEWPVLGTKWVGPYLVLRSTDLLLDGVFACLLTLFFVYLIYLRRLEISRLAWLFLLFAVVIYLMVPSTIFGVNVVDVRLPAAFVFFLIAMMRWRIDTARATVVFNGIIVVLFLVRLIGVTEAWQSYRDIVSDYEELFIRIKPGSRVLVTGDIAAGWQGSGNRVTINMDRLTILHLPTLAVIERSCFVSTVFADPGKQILAVTGPYRDLIGRDPAGPLEVGYLSRPSEEISRLHPYIRDWRDRFDYIFVLYAPPGSDPSIPNVNLVYQGGSFQLYKVIRPQ